LYIDGAWCDAAQDERFLVSAPATGASPAYVAGADAADVDRAVMPPVPPLTVAPGRRPCTSFAPCAPLAVQRTIA